MIMSNMTTPKLNDVLARVYDNFYAHNNQSWIFQNSLGMHPQPIAPKSLSNGVSLEDLDTFGLIQVVILVMASLIGAIANLLIVLVIIVTKKLHRLVNAFVFNQAIIDFLICAVFLPLHTAILAQNSPPGSACDVIGGVIMWIHTASFLGLSPIAYSRFLVITQTRQNYTKYIGVFITTLIVVTVWLFPLLLTAPSFFNIFTFEYSFKARDCFIKLDNGVEYFLLIKSFILFVGPVFGIFFIYFRIFDFVKSNKSLNDSVRKREVLVTKHLFIAFMVTVICLIPFNIAILSNRQNDVPSDLFRASISLSWINKATNPVLYMWRNKSFNTGLWSFIYRLIGREDLRHRVRAISI